MLAWLPSSPTAVWGHRGRRRGTVSLPFISGARVLDVAVLIARDGHRPVGDEGAHEAHPRFLHHPSGDGVDCHGRGYNPVHPELGEPLGDQRPRSPCRVPPSPDRAAQPVAQFRLVLWVVGAGPEMEPAEEFPGRLLERGPEPVAGKALVVVKECREVGIPPLMYRITRGSLSSSTSSSASSPVNCRSRRRSVSRNVSVQTFSHRGKIRAYLRGGRSDARLRYPTGVSPRPVRKSLARCAWSE